MTSVWTLLHRHHRGRATRWLDGLKLGTQSWSKTSRTVLHTLFEFAEARGYVLKGANPVASTEAVKVNGGDIEIFTPEEIGKLLKGASATFLPMVAIGAFCRAPLCRDRTDRMEGHRHRRGNFITVATVTRPRPRPGAWLPSCPIWRSGWHPARTGRAKSGRAHRTTCKTQGPSV